VFHALGPSSLARKQRRDSPLHEYTGGGGLPTMQLHGKEEAIGGRWSSQTSVRGRQGGREGLGSHVGRTKRSVLLVFAPFTGPDTLPS
jgi:hypothetical protein